MAAGIRPDDVLLDPGLGFAKLAAHNWELLRRLDELAALGHRLVLGTSRKRFLGLVGRTPRPSAPPLARDVATAATTLYAAQHGVWAVRVHDVAGTVDALDVADALRGPRERATASPATASGSPACGAAASTASSSTSGARARSSSSTSSSPSTSRRPGPSDDLADTVNYGEIGAAALARIEGEPHDLIERLAELVAAGRPRPPGRRRGHRHRAQAAGPGRGAVRRRHGRGDPPPGARAGRRRGRRQPPARARPPRRPRRPRSRHWPATRRYGSSRHPRSTTPTRSAGRSSRLRQRRRARPHRAVARARCCGSCTRSRRRSTAPGVRWGPAPSTSTSCSTATRPTAPTSRRMPRLTLPHPRAHERAFVLVPWLEADPEATLRRDGRSSRVADLVAGSTPPGSAATTTAPDPRRRTRELMRHKEIRVQTLALVAAAAGHRVVRRLRPCSPATARSCRAVHARRGAAPRHGRARCCGSRGRCGATSRAERPRRSTPCGPPAPWCSPRPPPSPGRPPPGGMPGSSSSCSP